MNETTVQNLRSVAASSAMEGLPLKQKQVEDVTQLMDGKITITEYIAMLKKRYSEV
jgi:hypothetical protein